MMYVYSNIHQRTCTFIERWIKEWVGVMNDVEGKKWVRESGDNFEVHKYYSSKQT